MRTAPLLESFGQWLAKVRAPVSDVPSRLGEKLTHIHNQREGLPTFLTDGCVEIHSNRVDTWSARLSSTARTLPSPDIVRAGEPRGSSLRQLRPPR
ncbi:MAG: hypothetical protein AAGA32_04245 [Pseudomonadota bacterium]